MRTHAIGYRRADEIGWFGDRAPVFCRKQHCQVGKRFGLARSRGINPLRVPCGQCTNITIGCERLRHAAKQIETNMSRRFGVTRDASTGEQRLDLRGETQSPAIIGGIQWFYPIWISREKKSTPLLIPNRK